MRDHRIRRADGPASRSCCRASSDSSTAATTRPGIALLEDDGLDYVRAVGNLQILKEAAGSNGSAATTGPRPHALGDARRASTLENAHPLTGCDERQDRDRPQRDRRELPRAEGVARAPRATPSLRDGRRGRRRTCRAPLRRATSSRPCARPTRELEGHFAFVVIHHDHPDVLVGARHQCPLVVGVGEGEMFLASSVAAFLARDAARPADRGRRDRRDHARRRPLLLASTDGELEREVIEVDWDDEAAEKSGYETFMLKEIYEQPEAVARDDRRPDPPRPARARGPRPDRRASCSNLRRIVDRRLRHRVPRRRRRPLRDRGVGARSRSSPTSRASGIYRNPVLSKDTLVIGISQSGETARHGRRDAARPRDAARTRSRSRT